MKRGASSISQGQTLEEAVFQYIQTWQEWENGEGVGISCDDLNNNIPHLDKPHGKNAEKSFVALMRAMPTLIESERRWEGKIVFKINETQSDLTEAMKLLGTATDYGWRRLYALHPSAGRVNISREDFKQMLEELMAAFKN